MRSISNFLSCVSFIFCGLQELHAQDSLWVQINRLGAAAFEKSKAPGMLVATLQDGKMNFYTWGFADLAQQKKFDGNTVFEAASISKTFTAFILEKVLAQIRIADTASILPYLPDSVQSNQALQKITFLSLLNHTSGLPRMPGNFTPANPAQPYADYTADRLFAYLKTAKPQPNGKSNYSNLGAALAGVLAQRISGKSFSALLRDFIYNPLGIDVPGNNKLQKAVGYNAGKSVAFWQWDIMEPAGGLQLTAHQLLGYLSFMAMPPKQEAAFINKFLEPTVIINANLQVARGWHVLQEKEKPVVYWHNGGSYGFSTFAAFTPGRNNAVVVVANGFGANAVVDRLGFALFYQLAK